jgi:hypothetical protein
LLPETLPKAAVMSDEPTPWPVAKPPGATVATPGVSEDHVTEEVMFRELASEYVPVAVSCMAMP